MRDIPVPVRLGLVETQAAAHLARYGYYPAAYMMMVKMYCGGVVPSRVRDLARRLREEAAWQPPPDPHPGMVAIHYGPHVFLVPRAEVLSARAT